MLLELLVRFWRDTWGIASLVFLIRDPQELLLRKYFWSDPVSCLFYSSHARISHSVGKYHVLYGINHFPSKILFGSIWSDWSLHVALNCEVYTVISGAATAQLGDYFLAAYETGFTIKRVPYMWNDPKREGKSPAEMLYRVFFSLKRIHWNADDFFASVSEMIDFG